MKQNYAFRNFVFLILCIAGTGCFFKAQAQHGWEQLSPYNTPRFSIASCVIDQDVYILGGWIDPVVPLATTEAYNVDSQESTILGNMSVGLAFPTSDTIDKKIYICGGFIDNHRTHNLLQEYDPVLDSFRVKKEVPQNIGHHVSGVIDGKLYVAGGLQKGATIADFKVSRSFTYDYNTNNWDTVAPMISTILLDEQSSGRIQASSCVYKGKLYVFGGFRFSQSEPDDYLPTPEMYTPDEDTWTVLSDMPLKLAHHTSVVYNDKIYLFGGTTEHDYGDGSVTPSDRVFEFDPAGDSWQEMEPMPLALAGTEGHVIDNFLYLIGGDDDSQLGGEEAGQVWRFNMDSLKVVKGPSGIEPYQESLLSLRNQPNPFVENTTIRYELKEGGAVELFVYDMLGRKMATIVEEEQVPGQYRYSWRDDDSESGIYFCRLNMKGSSHTIKMVKR